MSRGPEQGRPTDGQQTCEKMPNISHHQGNANPNTGETPPHTCWNGCHQRDKK